MDATSDESIPPDKKHPTSTSLLIVLLLLDLIFHQLFFYNLHNFLLFKFFKCRFLSIIFFNSIDDVLCRETYVRIFASSL